MSRLPGFCAGFGTVFSRNVNAEDTVNYILESAPGQPKAAPNLYSRPGIAPFILTPDGPVRCGIGDVGPGGRSFAVGGNLFVETFASATYVLRGYVAFDINPATMCTNGEAGHQVLVCSGGFLYVFDLLTNTFTQLMVDFTATMVDFIDGYGVALETGSNIWRFSNLEDFTVWDALDVNQVSESSNELVSLVVQNREVWLGGTRQTEPWQDVGVGNTTFAPVSGAQIQMGVAAPWSVQRCDNTLFFIGLNEQGSNMVWRMQGYTPSRISNFAVENYLRTLPTTQDIIGWTYQDGGHLCYLLYSPHADHTLCYDVSSREWVKYAHWNADAVNWIPFRGRCHWVAFGGRHFVGDRRSGMIYEMSVDYLIDMLGT
jgi:hypothetical protein